MKRRQPRPQPTELSPARQEENDDPLAYGRMLRELTQNLKQRNAAARHAQNTAKTRCKKKISALVAQLLEQDEQR